MVSIPLPQVGIPRLRYGKNKSGVGQGQGQKGDGAGEGQQAGDQPGEHALEVEFTVEELAEIMGEELELPRIEPKGSKDSAITVKHQYKGIAKSWARVAAPLQAHVPPGPAPQHRRGPVRHPPARGRARSRTTSATAPSW